MLVNGAVDELRKKLPDHLAEHLVARPAHEVKDRFVEVRVAVLPVQRNEPLVDVLEHGAHARVAAGEATSERIAEVAVEQRGHSARRGAARHADI